MAYEGCKKVSKQVGDGEKEFVKTKQSSETSLDLSFFPPFFRVKGYQTQTDKNSKVQSLCKKSMHSYDFE